MSDLWLPLHLRSVPSEMNGSTQTFRDGLPEKGQRIRVTRCMNDAGQMLPGFDGVVEGIEFRLTPPIVSVIEQRPEGGGGLRHDIQNFGNGSEWEPLSEKVKHD